jgi:spermidine/putrescine transport system ATP-binding protein
MNFLTTRDIKVSGGEISAEIPGFGRMLCRMPNALREAPTKAAFGIRPERLRILWGADSSERELRGEVVDRHYYGEMTNLVVSIDGQETPLSVVETNDFGADDIPVGSQVRLAYDRDALIAMRG